MRTHAVGIRAFPIATRPRPAASTPAVRAILRGPGIQPKLRVGAPNDPAEREADRIADRVMRMPEPQVEHASHACACGGRCPECRDGQPRRAHERLPTGRVQAGQITAPSIGQAVAAARGRPAGPPSPGLTVPRPGHEALRDGLSSPGEPLSTTARTFFEDRLPYDFTRIRLHTGPAAARSAASIGAIAYTLGGDVVLGGAWSRMSAAARNRVLTHELVHVVQQGAAGPTDHAVGELDRPSKVGPHLQRAEDDAALPLFCGTYEDWIRLRLGIEPGPVSDFVTCFCLGAQFADVAPGVGIMPGVEAADCLCNVLSGLQLAFNVASDGGCIDWSKVTEDDAMRVGAFLGATVVDCAPTLRLLAGALAISLVGTSGGAASGGPAGAAGGGLGGAAAGVIAGDMLVDGMAMAVQNSALHTEYEQYFPENQWRACERTWARFQKQIPLPSGLK